MTAPKITVITTSFPRFLGDEASLFLGRLVDALSKEGASGVISVPYDEKELTDDTRGNFAIHRVRYGLFGRGRLAFGQGILPNLRKNPFLLLQAPLMLLQLFRGALKNREHWELIHGHWIVTAFPAFLLHIVTKKPFIITVRGEDIKLLRTPLKHLFVPILNRATHLTTVSDEFKREISECCPSLRDKLSTVPNGITRFQITNEQKEQVKESLKISSSTRHVLTYVGRVVPLKQPELLIEMLSKLSFASECCLVLAGRITENYKAELLSHAKQHGVADQVILPGALTPIQIGALYAISKIYLSASTHEGRSNSVLEALANGLPACVSQIPGHCELIKHDENGMLFSVNSAEDAAIQLTSLLEDPGRWDKISQKAKESVASLTWKECAKLYISHFSDALRAAGP